MKKNSHSRRIRLGYHERTVLEELSAKDVLVGFLLSAHSTKRMYAVARERAKKRYAMKSAIDRLEREGFISRAGEMLSITPTGYSLLEKAVSTTRALLSKKPKWDGKWRLVTYDIPDMHSDLRQAVRATLKRAGFKMLQNSVWVFPYECADLSRLIKEKSELEEYILYGVLERIEHDEKLKKAFSL